MPIVVKNETISYSIIEKPVVARHLDIKCSNMSSLL